MKPSWNVTLVAILMVTLYVGFGWIMHWQLITFEKLVEKLQTKPMTITKSILTASRDASNISRSARELMLSGDKRHRLALLNEIELYEKDIVKNIELVKERIEGQDGLELINKTMQLMKQEANLRERLVALVFAGKFDEATELSRQEATPIMMHIEEYMDKIASYAETLGMSYHIESINSLKQARVILYTAGLIIALLSLVFSIVLGRSLLRGFLATQQALKEANTKPVDLTVRLKTPSPHGINETINDLMAHIAQTISEAQDELAHLRAGEAQSNNVHSPSEQFEVNMARMKQSLAQFSDAQGNVQPIYQQVHRLLRQIRGDLILASQVLVSMRSMADQQSATMAAREIKDIVDQSAASLKEVTDVFEPLFTHYNEIVKLEQEQIGIARELAHLVNPLEINEQRLNELKNGMDKLSAILKSFTVAKAW